KVEEKNLNRILNTKMSDAKSNLYKVDVLRDSIEQMGLSTQVEVFRSNIFSDKTVINKISECDVIFGCVDSVDGRFLLNQLATFYLIPYFDVGVKILSDKKGGFEQICGNVHYLKPGGSSLKSRGLFTSEEVR